MPRNGGPGRHRAHRGERQDRSPPAGGASCPLGPFDLVPAGTGRGLGVVLCCLRATGWRTGLPCARRWRSAVPPLPRACRHGGSTRRLGEHRRGDRRPASASEALPGRQERQRVMSRRLLHGPGRPDRPRDRVHQDGRRGRRRPVRRHLAQGPRQAADGLSPRAHAWPRRGGWCSVTLCPVPAKPILIGFSFAACRPRWTPGVTIRRRLDPARRRRRGCRPSGRPSFAPRRRSVPGGSAGLPARTLRAFA